MGTGVVHPRLQHENELLTLRSHNQVWITVEVMLEKYVTGVSNGSWDSD